MYLAQSLLLAIGLFSYGCQSSSTPAQKTATTNPAMYFAQAVSDSFAIYTQLPLEYQDSTHKQYPLVVVLDANFHFPMLAASLHQYEKGGLLPPLIVVGIGYPSFALMDSLRVRDYLYPAALPTDELKAPGGGEAFRQFVTQELLPTIDSTYRTSPKNRTLLGHSFGGYFALYTLLSQAKNKTREFDNVVAASPSVWYHNFYLNQLPTALATLSQQAPMRLFLSVGSQENAQWDVKPIEALRAAIQQTKQVRLAGGVYNHLDHMDTGQLSFLKGLQSVYR
jgi:predicted alpha/beta superfamily hydrolase